MIKYLSLFACIFIVMTSIVGAEQFNKEKLLGVSLDFGFFAGAPGALGIFSLGLLFAWAKSKVIGIVATLAIGVFIFIGFKFIMARGNPEEFKKTWMYFIYAVIGIFAVFMARGLVKLVSSLSI